MNDTSTTAEQQVTVHGASDDLIEIGGDLREEFNPPFETHEPCYLAFGDGKETDHE